MTALALHASSAIVARAAILPGSDVFERALEAAAAVEPNPRRSKLVAFEALSVLYPDYGNIRLGLRLGFAQPSQATAMINSAKDAFWWKDTQVDDVIGALVASQYGERAA